ncbi:TolC family protein [Algivirga pacifica]|uniref:TolC family protein n=1 Tax=Algivirga pacifica TaxID=1162670 RepID=UPI0031E78F65
MLGLLGLAGMPIGHTQSLEDYYRIAAESNPGLQARYKAFEASLQKAAQAKALPDPMLSMGVFLAPVETRVGPQQAKFSLTQQFPWFGTLSAQNEVAAALAEVKYQEFLDARNQLYYQVALAYYPFYEWKEWKMLEDENIILLESFKALATTKFRNGKGTMVDVLRVDIMLKEAQTNLDILNKKENALRSCFNAILNRSWEEEVVVKDTLEATLLIDYSKDSLLEGNPVLDIINAKVKASEAGIQVAQKQALPKFGVGLDYVMVGKRDDMDLPDNGKDVWMPMVSVSIPFFSKKYQAQQEEAKLLTESYRLQKEEVKNQLFGNYHRLYFQLEQQQDLLVLYEQQIQESEQILNLLFTAYSNSGKDFEEVLRVQQQLLLLQKKQVSTLVEWNVLKAQLEFIILGGS